MSHLWPVCDRVLMWHAFLLDPCVLLWWFTSSLKKNAHGTTRLHQQESKEIVVEFRKKKSVPALDTTESPNTEMVQTREVVSTRVFTWLKSWGVRHEHGQLVQKGQMQLYFPRRSFRVQGHLLQTFYTSVVSSAIFYAAVCWGSGINAQHSIQMRSTDSTI